MATTDLSNNQPEFTDILKNLSFEDPSKLAEKSTGLKISKRIYDTQMGPGIGDSMNFFANRAAHWKILEDWSLGKQDMRQFLPYMNIVDANKSYAKIDTTPIAIGAQFVNTKLESIAKNEEYPIVKAIDDDSMKEKDDRMWEAFFRMKEVETITALQAESGGVPFEPADAYVPDDEISAKVYFELEDQIPKEIKFQKKLNDTLISNDYQRVLKPALLRDSIVFGMECTKVEKIKDREYCIRRCIGRNLFYNYFQSDTGKNELTYIGEGYNLKVKDARGKFGKSTSNPKGMSEQELYEFAKKSAQLSPANQGGFNHQFGPQFNEFNGTTPWDDFACYVIDFEIQVSESEYFVSKVDNYGKSNIQPKKGVPKPISETAVIQKRDKKRWYRGVYAPYANMMLYWGKPDITILDYNNTENSFCSYSPVIPNNNGEYVPSLFERALEPLKEYALAKLKRKLLLGKLSPAMYKINVDGIRNITTGNGRTYEWEEIVSIKDTTGVELTSSKGLDPTQPAAPTFSEATHDPTMDNINALSDLMDSIRMEIRELLGTPIYLDGSDVGERTAAKLAAGQTAGSFNVTGFVSNGHNQCMEETLNKICICLWQDIVTDKKETEHDLINTRFRTYVKMKVTDEEKKLLEDDITRYSQMPDANGQPSLMPKDAMMLRQITDYTLACWYLSAVFEKNRRNAAAEKDRAEKNNAASQQESLKIGGQNDLDLQAQKQKDDKEMKMLEGTQAKELAVLTGYMAAVAKGVMSPDMVLPVVQQLMPNLQIPLGMQNKTFAQAAQIQDEIMAQQEQQNGQPPQQGAPEEAAEIQQEPAQQEMAEQPMM